MKYFCSYSHIYGNTPHFGNCALETTIDPYDDIDGFHDTLEEYVGLPNVILLFYKKVKS